VVSFVPWPVYSRGKSPQYSLNKRLCGPQSWSGCLGEAKIFCFCWELKHGSSVLQFEAWSLYGVIPQHHNFCVLITSNVKLPTAFLSHVPCRIYNPQSSAVINNKTIMLIYLYFSWMKRDQLVVTCFIISLFNAQHVSDVNTSIIRSLRLICWVISWVALLWFDVCWCYVVVWLGWCGVVSGYHTTPAKPQLNTNTHWTRAIQPMK